MNTPAHVLVAAALLAKPDASKRNWIIAAGALLPDAWMFVFFAWAQFAGLSPSETWNEAYWSEPWQTIGAIFNSVPLALLILAIGFIWKRELVTLFALALLTHAALDFPLHADDAHRHFWPLSDWRFISPVSYWDRDHNIVAGMMAEGLCLILAALALWRRFDARWVRISAAGLAALYVVAAFVRLSN